MRQINDIIVHCSATKEGRDYTVADIDRWHKARGWRCIGYHYVIYRDGSVHAGRPVEQIGAHVTNHNANSIGICYIGGLDASGNPKDTRLSSAKPCANWLATCKRDFRARHYTATATTRLKPARPLTFTKIYSL